MPLGDDIYHSYQISSLATNQGLAADTINGDADFPQLSRSISTDEGRAISTDLERASAARVTGIIDDLLGDSEFMDHWTSQLQHISNEDSTMQPVVGECPNYSIMGPRGLPGDLEAWNHNTIQDLGIYSSASTTLHPLPNPISLYHVGLSNSIILAPEDHNALIYYQSDIGPCQTTKSPRWSFSALLLRLALRSTMIMHLLLAVSIYDLSMLQNTPRNLQAASAHFKEGTKMLMENITHGAAGDYPAIISAFYFIYLYLTRQVCMDRLEIERLSRIAIDYIEQCSFDGLEHTLSPTTQLSTHSDTLECKGPPAPTTAQRCNSSMAARLIIWLYSEDSFISFYGCGGGLSTCLSKNPGRLDRFRQISSDALSLNWGDEYPAGEVLVDINHFHPIDMLIDMITLHREIIEHNNAYMETGFVETSYKLDSRFSILEIVCTLLDIEVIMYCTNTMTIQKYASVFRLANSTPNENSEIWLNSAISIIVYHALQICWARCTGSSFGSPASPSTKCALELLLTLAQRICRRSSPPKFERFHWALFIAGIETNDLLHREWILGRISGVRLNIAIVKVLAIKDRSGTISMATIRNLLSREFA